MLLRYLHEVHKISIEYGNKVPLNLNGEGLVGAVGFEPTTSAIYPHYRGCRRGISRCANHYATPAESERGVKRIRTNDLCHVVAALYH